MGFWFIAGAWLILIGYAFTYVGWTNLRNGGAGPTLSEALGLTQVFPGLGGTASQSGTTGKAKVGGAVIGMA